MRTLISALVFVWCASLSVEAQNFEVNYYESVDLYEGLDQHFYSGSNFGVKNPVYSAFPVTTMIRHNRVDGLFIGYKEEKMDWGNSDFLGLDNLDVHGLIGYSVAQKDIQYTIGAEKSIGIHRKWLLLGGEMYNTTSSDDYWRSGIIENSVSSFTTGFDFHDYYNVDGFGFYTLVKPFKFLELGAAYNQDQFSSLDAITDFSVISRYSTYRMNPAIDSELEQFDQQSVTLGLTLNPESLSKRSWIWTTFSAKAELADMGGMDNNFMYNRYQVEAKSFLRLDRSTLVKWRVMAGSITGDAPDFKNFALGGIGTMRALGYKLLSGNQMLLSNIELELGKRSSHNGNWADLSSFYISLFMDSGTSQINPNYFDTGNPVTHFDISFSELSHNAGIGIGMGMIRVEVAKPVAGAEGQTSFWIRFNPTF